jgi:chromosome segregation ATPase
MYFSGTLLAYLERITTMNQPTEDRIKQFEERQAEFEKRLRQVERHTEPIKITQLEIDSGGIFRRLDEIKEDTNTTKTQMEGVRGDLLQISESQADLKDRIIEHGQHLEAIKDKQEAHTEILGKLLYLTEEYGKKLETVATKEDIKNMATKEDLKDMATKNDISALKGNISRLETRLNGHEDLLRQILDRLPPKQ